MSEQTTPPDGFWLALPDGWFTLDINPETSAQSIRTIVRAAIAGDERLAQFQGLLEQTFSQTTRDVVAAGAQFCACYFNMINETLPIQASVTVSIVRTEGGNGRSVIEREIASEGTTTSLVEIAAGQAVRRTRRRKEAVDGSDPLELVSAGYFVPVPATEDQVAIAQFITPSVFIADDMLDLFDTMMKTFEFTWLDAEGSNS